MRVVAALPLVLALAFSSQGCARDTDVELPARRVEPVVTAKPAFAFAPLVELDARERSFPMSADRFLERATLKWVDRRCRIMATVATGRIANRKAAEGVPRLRADRLGGVRAPYRRRQLDRGCRRPEGRGYATSDLTRPYQAARAVGLRRDAGFYLDLLTDSYDGDPRFTDVEGRRHLRASAYYATRPVVVGSRHGVRIVYLFLYAREERMTAGGSSLYSHEGDWERIDVIAVRGRAARTWLPLWLETGRGAAHRTPWGDLRVDDGETAAHPVLSSARANHALTPSVVPCADCVLWSTWRRLSSLQSQPWVRFAGGWGLAFQTAVRSGPLRPSVGGPPAISAER